MEKFIHLPQSIYSGILLSKETRGTGFPRLEHLVPRMALKLDLSCIGSCDPLLALLGCTSRMAHLHKLETFVRINYPSNASDLRQYKRQCATTELEVWKGYEVHGMAVLLSGEIR